MKSILILTLAILAVGLMGAIGPKRVLQFALEPVKAVAERMFVLQIVPSPKAVVILVPKSYTAAGTALSAAIDCAGYDHLTIDTVLGTADTTAHQPTALKLSESDDTTTTVTDILAFVGGTALATNVGYVIPASDTSNPQIIKFNVDLKKRKRYLRLAMTAATVQLAGSTGNLQRAEQVPVSAADAGAAVLVSL